MPGCASCCIAHPDSRCPGVPPGTPHHRAAASGQAGPDAPTPFPGHPAEKNNPHKKQSLAETNRIGTQIALGKYSPALLPGPGAQGCAGMNKPMEACQVQKPGMACRQVAAVIRDYLIAHPSAADSDQGIADWWLAGSGLQVSLDDVRQALELLASRQIVEKQMLADGRLIYRAAHRSGRPPH